jgi:hypothetical protein
VIINGWGEEPHAMTPDPARQAAEKWLADKYTMMLPNQRDYPTIGHLMDEFARIAADFAERGMRAVRNSCLREVRSNICVARESSPIPGSWKGSGPDLLATIGDEIEARPLPWAEATKEGGE